MASPCKLENAAELCGRRVVLDAEYRTVGGVSGPLVVVECVKVGATGHTGQSSHEC